MINNPLYFLGIDIGKDAFTASLYHTPTNTYQTFIGQMHCKTSNGLTASRKILKWLKQQKVDATQTIMVLDAYGRTAPWQSV